MGIFKHNGLRLLYALMFIVGISFITCGISSAFTLEYAPQKVEELEKEYEEVLMDLSDLEHELKEVTKNETPLKNRADYVKRILELRKKLKANEARRRELIGLIKELPHAPPILKLVSIEVPTISEGVKQNGAGFIIQQQEGINIDNRAESAIVTIIGSLIITKAPLEIRPNMPFTIEAEATIRKSYPDNHWCAWPMQGSEKSGFLGLAMSSKVTSAYVKGEKSLNSYCDEGNVQKHEWPLTADRIWYTKSATIRQDSVNIALSFIPEDKRIEGRWQKYYYTAKATGSGKLEIDTDKESPFYIFSLPTDKNGYLLPTVDKNASGHGEGAEGIKISIRMPLIADLVLTYEPVRETEPVLSSLKIPEHPREFQEPLKEGEVTSVHVVPDLVGLREGGAVQKLRMMGLEAQIKQGSQASSEELNGKVEAQMPEPGADVGRGEAVVLTIHSPYVPPGSVLPDLTGKPANEANVWLISNNFEVGLKPGSMAPSSDLSAAVETQDPAAGTRLLKGSKVMLTIYAPFVDIREVPNVKGLPANRAKEKLVAGGFEMRPFPGSVAPSKEKSGTVESQNPPYQTKIEAGATVEVRIHSDYVDLHEVPNIVGLSAIDAKQRLTAAGFDMKPLPGEPASTKNQEGTVERQEPAADNQTGSGAEVAVYIYGLYVAETSPSSQGQPVDLEKEAYNYLCPLSLTTQKNWNYYNFKYPPGTRVFRDPNKYMGKVRTSENKLTAKDSNVYKIKEFSCSYKVGPDDRDITIAFERIRWLPGKKNPPQGYSCFKDREWKKDVLGNPYLGFEIHSRTKLVSVKAAWGNFDKQELYEHAREIIRKIEPYALPCGNN